MKTMAILLVGFSILITSAIAQDPPEKPSAPAEKQMTPEEAETQRLERQRSRLAAEQQLEIEEQNARLRSSILEKQRLEIENALTDARARKNFADMAATNQLLKMEAELAASQLKIQTAALVHENQELALRNSLAAARQQQQMQELQAELDRTKLELELAKIRQTKTLRDIEASKSKLELENALATEKQKAAVATLVSQNARLEQELVRAQKEHLKAVQAMSAAKDLLAVGNAKVAEEIKQLELAHQKAQSELLQNVSTLETELMLRQKKEDWRSAVDGDIEYDVAPFKDGVLTISDRRIPLNGAIIEGTADYVTTRIHFFNNQSTEHPIFIVIDRSPGGSVMEGYRIIKAMEASDAPIHVVVKSFAASMAATIATVAEHSYAYPNAILLHHQPSGAAWGNLTQQDEQIKIFKEWAKRLHAPVATKMGVSLERFYEMMYEKNSEGDWQEFADNAQKIHWIDEIATEIREEGYVKKPTDTAPRPFFWFMAKDGETPDPKKNHVLLPRPKSFDCYFIYNPDDYYRWGP